MITVTKRFDFCYGHHLPEYNGKCRNFHGHNSIVEVEVGPGKQNPYPGMVMDFSKIKKVVEPIIDSLDHKNLNEHLGFQTFCSGEYKKTPFFIDKTIPTAELICSYLVYQILEQIPSLIRLRITETPDSWAEWRKE